MDADVSRRSLRADCRSAVLWNFYDQTGAKARIAVVFISLVYAGNVANMAIPSNVMLRPIVFRERGSHAYRLCPYYWAMLLAELPYITLQGSLFVFTFYFLVGFQPSVIHFLLFLSVL